VKVYEVKIVHKMLVEAPDEDIAFELVEEAYMDGELPFMDDGRLDNIEVEREVTEEIVEGTPVFGRT
jgi:hypothetical protein